MAKELDSIDLTYWKAYFERGSILDAQWDYRFGVLASLLAMLLRSWGNKSVAIEPSAYFKSLDKLKQKGGTSTPEQTPEQQYNIIVSWAIAMGAEVKRAEKQ